MNTWRIARALDSFRHLAEVIDQMTEQEIVQVIKLEEAGGRRKSLLDRLYRQHRKIARTNQVATIRSTNCNF